MPKDGSAWESGSLNRHRVLRGGNWSSKASELRVTYRNHYSPKYRRYGFRVAKDL